MSVSNANAATTTFLMAATDCTTVSDLDAKFLVMAQSFGFASAMFVLLASGGAPISPRVLFGDDNPWIVHYAEKNYAWLDPTIPRAFSSKTPFTWTDTEALFGAQLNRRFFGEAREAWAQDGFIVPIHGPLGEVSVVNLLSDRPIDLSPEEGALLRSVCSVYAAIGLTLAEGALPKPSLDLPHLSRRERQCVYWMSMGKHDNEIAGILKLSHHTIHQYLESAKSKLDAVTRPQLIVKAIAAGLFVADFGMVV